MTVPDPDDQPVDPAATEDVDDFVSDVADADPADVADQRRAVPGRDEGDRG